jgi:hypothetical protein
MEIEKRFKRDEKGSDKEIFYRWNEERRNIL